jgi:uncharacterized membrane protein YtjA (UPF0391 family)
MLPPGRGLSKGFTDQSHHRLPFLPRPDGQADEHLEPVPNLKVSQRNHGAAAARSAEFGVTLLKWALIFLVISIIAGILGFTGVSAASADIARFLFYVFVVIFLVLLILGLTIFRVQASRLRRRHCEEPRGPAFGRPDDRLRDEAIRVLTSSNMDCFRLRRGGGKVAEPVIGRSTRWLAMTLAP